VVVVAEGTEDLQKLGLTEYEAKAYIALLQEGTATGTLISKKSLVPQGKIYETLRKLIDKGLVLEKPTDPKQFQAIPAEHALKRWVEEKRSDIESLGEKAIADLKDLKPLAPSEKVSELISFVEGREKSFNIGALMFGRAQKEVSVISVGERIPYSLLRAAKEVVKRGLRYRFIATKNDAENHHILKEFRDIGMEIRCRQMQGFSLSLIDRKEALIILRKPEYPQDKESVGIHITSPDLSAALADYFEATWKKSEKINLI
jgi:sugar-specific transcriptional regulator TrmB